MKLPFVLIAVLGVLAGCGGGDETSEQSDPQSRPNTEAFFAGISDCDELLNLYTHSVIKATEESVKRPKNSLAYEGWLASVGFARARIVELGCPGVGEGSSTAPVAADNTFDDGTYQVGTDIEPGTYTTTGGDGCYWARLSDFSGETDAIIANDNAEGPAVVTIAPSDAGFTSSRCGT